MTPTGHRKFYVNTFMQYGLQIAKYCFPLLTIPYLTRILGPQTFAIRAYVLSFMSFFQVFLDYGFMGFGTKAIAESENDTERKSSITSTIITLRFFLSILGLIALLFLSKRIPLLSENTTFLFLSYATVMTKAMLPDFIFQGEENMAVISFRFVVTQSIGMSLIFLLVHQPSDLLLVPIIECFAASCGLIWSWHNVVSTRGIRFVSQPYHVLKEAFAESTSFFISNASTTLFTSLTTMMIGIMVPDKVQISYWSLSMTAVSAIQALYTPITNSLYPHMVKRRDFALAKRLLLIGMPAVIIGTISFVSLRNQILLVIGGEEYLEGSYVIALVAPVLVFSFPGMLIGFPILAAVGEVRKVTISSASAALFHVAGLVVLYALGCTTIVPVAILRDLTEAVMLAFRSWFVYSYFKGTKEDREGLPPTVSSGDAA